MPLLIEYNFGSITIEIWQEIERKDIHIEKEEVKLALFTDNINFYSQTKKKKKPVYTNDRI